MSLPGLVVFDLDFTLWDCGGTWCDCLSPPFDEQNGKVFDRWGHDIRLYPDVPAILDHLDAVGIPMALACRTHRPDWANELLTLLGISKRFRYQEIYPGSKIPHFQSLQSSSGLRYEDMLFFDDEHRNIREVGRLGVQARLVDNGMTLGIFRESVD